MKVTRTETPQVSIAFSELRSGAAFTLCTNDTLYIKAVDMRHEGTVCCVEPISGNIYTVLPSDKVIPQTQAKLVW